MTITNGQRDTLRVHPHLIKLYLSVLVPSQVYCGTVNGNQARGEMDIPLNNVSGNINNVLEGMTIVIGTSCGDDSISKRRVRDNSQIGGGIITIDENSLDLAGGEYVTVLRNFELWPRYPRILTATPWTFYKDYDITYTDENEAINPVAIAGPHQAGFLDGATVTFALDSSDSYALADGAAITGRTWSTTGGAIADVNAATTTITFNTAGTYWITLTVTDGTKTHTTRRVIFVHDRTGSNAPYTEFEFEIPPNGDWEQGGWNTGLVVRGDATASDFPDGTLVLVWYESWYGGTQAEIADENIGDNILFAGYIRRDSVIQDWDTGSVSFEATTIDDLMRNHMMFSISLQAPTGQDNQVLPRSPARWYEFDRNNLTVATAIHHLWYWHSTLLDITDVFLPTSNTLLIYAVDDFTEGDLYNQADTFARQHGIFAHVACNKKGQVYVEEDINLLDTAGRGAVSLVWNGGIQDSDRRDEIEILRQPEMQVPFVHFSGFSFDGATYTAIISKAPGDAPEAIGAGIKNIERQVLDDQAQANEIAGRALGVENDSYREFRIKFAGNYALFDIVPQQWLELTVAATDTPRGITLTNTKLVCRTVATEIDAANGTLLVDCVFVREASSEDGIAGDYPTDPPDADDPDDPDWPPIVAEETGALVAFDESEGCWYRGPQAADWVERDAGLPAGAVDNDLQGGWDPWWFTPEKQGTSNPAFAILFRCQDAHIYRSTNCGVNWEEITPTEDPPNSWGDSPAPTIADMIFKQRVDNIHVNQQHIFLAEWQSGTDWRSWLLKTSDDGETWAWHTLYISVAHVTSADASLITDNAADVTAAWKAAVGGDFDGTWYKIDENDDVIIYFPFNILADTEVWIYNRESPRTLVNGKCYDWDGAAWNLIGTNLGGPWGWDHFTTDNICDRYRLHYDQQPAIDDDWLIDAMYWDQSIVNTRVLWADVDTEDGTILWLTVWRGGRLYLQKRATTDLSLTSSYSMGDCTQAEMEAGTYFVFPHTPLGDKDLCFVFGRMSSPQDLVGIQHVVVTANGGASFSSVESGWATDLCTAFMASADDGSGNRTYTAIRDATAGSPARLYRDTNVLSFISNLTFGNNRGVLWDALTIANDGSIACGADSAGAIMVIFTVDPFTTWIDITDSYPATGVVRSLTYL